MKHIESHRSSVSLNLLRFVTICHLFVYGNVIGQECPSSCTSETCLHISSNFLRKLQPNIDPCDDFYGYVCGTYPEDTYITEDDDIVQDMHISRYPMYDRLLKILEQEPNGNSKSISAKRKIIHESCAKFNDTEKEIGNFCKWLSANVFPGWPYLSSTISHANVSEWLTKLYLVNEFSFFKLSISYLTAEMFLKDFDPYNAGLPEGFEDKFKVEIAPDHFLLLDYCPDVEKSRFIEFLYDLLDTIRVPLEKSTQIVNDAVEIDDFMRNAPEFSISSQDGNRDQTILDCKTQIEGNRWCDILHMVMEITKVDLSNATFKLSWPKYFDLIGNLLRQKPERAIANYLAVRFFVNNLKSLQNFSPLLILPCRAEPEEPGPFRENNFSLDKRTNCLRIFTIYFPAIIIKDYIMDAEVEAKLAEMDNMLKMIKSAAESFANSSTWIKGKIGELTLNEMRKFNIGNKEYVDHIMKNVDYAVRYTDLSPIEDNFAYNLLELKRILILDELKSYHLGYANAMITNMNLFITGAFSGIDIMFGFGFFEPPHANLHRPLLMDLGIVGTTFGHEISHILKNIINDFAEDEELFFNHMKDFQTCVSEKYSPFEIPEIKIKRDSERTFTEDFCDMIGIQFAYHAFKTLVSGNHLIHHKLPANNLTDEQMLFVAYGQEWCEFGDRGSYKFYLKTAHSPSMHRVNGPFKNFKPFAEAFGCPVGSNMNSGSDCKL